MCHTNLQVLERSTTPSGAIQFPPSDRAEGLGSLPNRFDGEPPCADPPDFEVHPNRGCGLAIFRGFQAKTKKVDV